MQDEFDLLTAVQPEEGWFAVVGIGDGPPFQRLVQTREEVDALAEKLVAQGRNAFFGVAKYATPDNRTKENVLALKAFWLDIDCGADKAELNPTTGKPKGYASQAEGMLALREFCAHVDLPKPIVVDSGRGLHVYWPLTESVTREEWQPVASRLRELCVKNDLYVDPAVFEVARILRIPGTFNFKSEEPAKVTVLLHGGASSLDDFKLLLGVREAPGLGFGPPPAHRANSYLAKKLAEDKVKLFGKIMLMGLGGCRQLISCYNERATLEEPRWFGALSIAKFCEDRDKALHLLSVGHPDYDPAKVRKKVQHILGPRTCAQFETGNPGGCSGCPHLGKIKSPIVLGTQVLEAEPNEEVTFAVEGKEEPEVFTVPDLPFPYFRGKTGGIWKRGDKGDNGEETEPIHIYPHDLYVVKRMRDPELGEVIILRLHLPHDGAREFPVPSVKITDPIDLRRALSASGVMCNKKSFEMLMQYLIASVSALQTEKKAEQMRNQMGWADNDRVFVVGENEVTAAGVLHAPPAPGNKQLAQFLTPTGDIEEWKKVWELYGREGLEPHAFAALAAFGAPLLKFSGMDGVLLNMVHPHSGTGKTTILRMINSVWGSPNRLTATKDDTQNTKIHRLGQHNNLPVTYDEMTNTSPSNLSELTYCVTQGRGKDRMKASVNEMRTNNTTWQTIAVCSSNASFYDKLSSFKNVADGENMRIIEYKISFCDAVTPEEAKYWFDDVLLHNYGHAGLIYAQYIVKNLEAVKREYAVLRAQIDLRLGIQQAERYWSAGVAAHLLGGIIAQRLGLLVGWNIKRISDWSCNTIASLRQFIVLDKPDDPMAIIGEYLNDRFRNTLIINDDPDIKHFPIHQPVGELLVRIEPNNKRMWLSTKQFQSHCVGQQISYRDALEQLRAQGVYLGPGTKRMAAGMPGFVSAPVYSYVFDTDAAGFTDFDAMIEEFYAGEDISG